MLDPGDAWPWLVRLGEARQGSDEAAVTQALFQIAQRDRASTRARLLSATMTEVIGPEPTLGEAWALIAAVGTDMSNHLRGSLTSVGRACGPVALKDANRRQLCEQAARRLPAMASETMDAGALYSLEERLGLPHSPQALSREDISRSQQVFSEQSMAWLEEPSCANVSGMGRQLVKLAREGELASMRAYLKAAPAASPR